ncbi:MAG: hypothetical protein EAX96_17775 [Candidatus Lokiarchaeota archaeon]|nr:hypothetical protein [Candidatus Lokiarchaeota archaeon]
MINWLEIFKFDPIFPIMTSTNKAILYHSSRDLLDENVEPIEILWELDPVKRILRKQLKDGSWKMPGKPDQYGENKYLVETYKMLGLLIEKYGLNKNNTAIEKAAEYVFTCQTEEGDFRGIYATQYSPNYTGGILELLIKAGYENDSRVKKCFEWLLSIRHDDGGWAIPMLPMGVHWLEAYKQADPIQPDRSKKSSHWVTDVVLRAFAAHPSYRKYKEAYEAGTFLASRFFRSDNYSSRQKPEYWLKLAFPFWWGDLLSSLDSLSQLGFNKNELQIRKSLSWFVENQREDGLWTLKNLKWRGDKEVSKWINYAICRMFKRFYL